MKYNFINNFKYQLSEDEGNNSTLGMQRRIFLIGMMGTGKSYWAQRIATAQKIDWMDLDAQIEKKVFMTIKEIFETKGEGHFRNKEQQALKELSAFQHIVIATGGGTPCFHDNMQWMNSHGITIWIDEPIEMLAARLKKEKAHRPLIKHLTDEELLHFLSIKLAERTKYYALAHHHLQGSNISERSFAAILSQHE